ncbi:nucleoside hydrolase [Corynebacterium pelargi]|uniref:Pyrimidine-specific ribonucleoside hydrolase RihA n=1 Tax=Corynebacterium pelargi TaxID=1471400 RepID=A0A410WB80_9CORY|nr:nucleoside hydrolase [Corynebacterium pelargi]QAU53194.1 Pyrimidine-specific ribonucleoside hydrolase RihA [Corynebacterium pelargi]GGG74152.1 inosine-uridine nucleoside N-ribohydrolase [Corynebacterium pelargi]
MTKATTPPSIFADVDTGIDDMLALIYLCALHRAEEITLAGVSANAGNTTATMAANNTRYILNLLHCHDVPVALGAQSPLRVPLTITPETHGPAGLGYVFAPGNEQAKNLSVAAGVVPEARVMQALQRPSPLAPGILEDAPRLWRQVLNTYPQCRLLVSGPGTSVAQHLELAREFSHITVMGGAVDYPGNTTEHAEWNFWSDPDAAQALLSLHPTLLSLQISEQITITPEVLDSLAMPAELHKVVAEALRFYFEFHQAMGEGYLAQVHDLAAAMIACGTASYATTACKLALDPADRGALKSGQGDEVAVISRLEAAAVEEELRRACALLGK